MSRITVNGTKTLDGAFSFSQVLNETKKPAVITIEGTAELEEYVKDLQSLKNDRYEITGIHVIQESFGSEEDNIVYTFTAKKFKILKNGA